MMTVHPALPRAIAAARPMPDEAPVTRAMPGCVRARDDMLGELGEGTVRGAELSGLGPGEVAGQNRFEPA